MNKVYNWFGGRKLFYFNLLLLANIFLLLKGSWVEGFGYFCIGLYAVVVAGVETTKYIRGKNE